MAVKKSEIFSVFYECVRKMHTPNILLKIFHRTAKMFAPFYIMDYKVHVCHEECIDKIQIGSIINHEIGHMVYSPISLANGRLLNEEIATQNSVDIQNAHLISNLCEDMVVDYSIQKFNDDNLLHRMTVLMDKKNKSNKPAQPNVYMDSLTEYYSLLVNKNLVKIKDRRARLIAKKAFDIVQMNINTNNKVLRIAEMYIDESKKNKDMEQLIQATKQSSDVTGTSQGFNSTGDSQSSKNQQDYTNKVSDQVANDSQNKGYSKTGQFFGVTITNQDSILAQARKNIRIKGLTFNYRKGKQASCGFESWRLNNSPEDLDVIETLEDSGLIIPEVTSLMKSSKIGYDEVERGCPEIMLVVDTSGSMNLNHALISMCSFIEAARHYYVKVGVILFECNSYYIQQLTYKYDDLINDIFKKIKSGGTEIKKAISTLDTMNLRNSLIVMVTDWEDYEPESLVKEFQKLRSSDKITVNFGDKLPFKHSLKEIVIRDTGELDNTLIDLVNDVIRKN